VDGGGAQFIKEADREIAKGTAAGEMGERRGVSSTTPREIIATSQEETQRQT